MTSRTRPGAATTRGIFLMLAALAVALKVMIPAGFMTRQAANDLPFALVLCTAQGAVKVEPGQAAPAHDDRGDLADHDSPCAFAGHATAAPAPSPIATGAVEFVAYRAVTTRPLVDLAPGRGLAAPPLPARGPPSLLI
ncbi:hypothetical protein M9M90_14695 [Phenylobacterium sp. LH3H17]|uniref:DUF2946 family protein n=1 Tax=Phenylobacterium sp. LH3H17 TaxID=2903901 RepID=UPI0020C94D99|nr:DUF2946 family protein [Phenylobacterium sp. LH3H17]UTP38458.1 hypothetical protein M9M90_14695 [Phenylobacterium sp. LH3H17]